MGEGLRETAAGGAIGLVAGAGAGALIVLLAGPPYHTAAGMAIGAVGGLLYGALFGVTCCYTRCRSHYRRRRRFIVGRLPLVLAVCFALVLLPGALLGLLRALHQSVEHRAVYSPLTVLLGLLLSVYVGFLWVRLLRRGHS